MIPPSSNSRVRLSSRHHDPRQTGHPWIYAGHIEETWGNPQTGDVVDVYLAGKQFCGRGFYNSHSKIHVRLLTFHDDVIDAEFFRTRIRSAVRLRQRMSLSSNAYRLVHGESDLLPGLIIDRYGDVAVMQTLSYGMDQRKEVLADLLMIETGVKTVYLRNDAKSRSLEGLPLECGLLRGEDITTVDIFEDDAQFFVDIAEGQKTGWFCDQRDNRAAASRLAKNVNVLEVFCHTGAFGVHAALRGAGSIEGIDSSEPALALARRHATKNNIDQICQYRQADAFQELRTLDRSGHRYGLVILDPPSFARSRHAVQHALAGYKELNLQALKLLEPEGILVTCSCSHHVTENDFLKMIQAAGRDARRQIRLIEQRSQGPDHPVLISMPETRYLKCFILQAI
jgi:23S rRNA (cytosine1962-C5)-methyltransferase